MRLCVTSGCCSGPWRLASRAEATHGQRSAARHPVNPDGSASTAAWGGTPLRRQDNPTVLKMHIAQGKQGQLAMTTRRNPLLPWYIGLIIIAIVNVYIGYQFYATKCEAPGLAQILVLIVVPGVYLVLMYLTFKSQD